MYKRKKKTALTHGFPLSKIFLSRTTKRSLDPVFKVDSHWPTSVTLHPNLAHSSPKPSATKGLFLQKAKDHYLNLKEFQRKAMELVTRKLCMISLHLPCQSLLVKKPMSVNMSWERARSFFPIKNRRFFKETPKNCVKQLATCNSKPNRFRDFLSKVLSLPRWIWHTSYWINFRTISIKRHQMCLKLITLSLVTLHSFPSNAFNSKSENRSQKIWIEYLSCPFKEYCWWKRLDK